MRHRHGYAAGAILGRGARYVLEAALTVIVLGAVVYLMALSQQPFHAFAAGTVIYAASYAAGRYDAGQGGTDGQ